MLSMLRLTRRCLAPQLGHSALSLCSLRSLRSLSSDAVERDAASSGPRRHRQHVNPLSAAYRDPITLPDWCACFADPSLPIHLDIGCARGKYLMAVATANAGRMNFVGVEIRKPVLEDAKEEARRRGIDNLALVHANMNVQQRLLLPSLPAAVRSVSIFHPDPWMKKRHLKRRLVNDQFVAELAELLPDGTPIYVQTDVRELFEYIVEVFESSQRFEAAKLSPSPLGVPTDRESFIAQQGGDIFRTQFTIRKPPQ